MEDKDILQFRVGPTWRKIEVVSEPYVILNTFGYQPALRILVEDKKIEQFMYISPKTLATPLENLRKQNDNKFNGLKFKLKKVSTDKNASYVIEEI